MDWSFILDLAKLRTTYAAYSIPAVHLVLCVQDKHEGFFDRSVHDTFMFRSPALVHAGRNVSYLPSNPSNDRESADERASSRDRAR